MVWRLIFEPLQDEEEVHGQHSRPEFRRPVDESVLQLRQQKVAVDLHGAVRSEERIENFADTRRPGQVNSLGLFVILLHPRQHPANIFRGHSSTRRQIKKSINQAFEV